MNSKEIKYLTEAYSNVYSEPQNNCQELYDSVLQFCILENLFDTLEECEDYAESLVVENLVEDFLVSILEHYEIDDIENLNESLEFLGENRAAALRGIINALSAGGRTKAGLSASTALGRRAETIARGSAASTSIRAARSARTPIPAPREPGTYLRLMNRRQEIRDLNRTRGLIGTNPPTRPSGAPGVGDPVGRAIQVGKRSKELSDKSQEAARLAIRAERMKKNNYGKLLKKPLAAVAAGLAAVAGGAGISALLGKKPKVGPEIVGPGKVGVGKVGVGKVGTISQAFDRSYSDAKKAKLKTFDFKGKKYSTESFDSYDVILHHIIDEGYADTNEEALVIMANMSEEWRESIILEQTLPSNYTDYKAPAVQASHARSMGDASRMRQMGMNATSVDPEDDAQSNLNAVKSGNGVAKPLSGTTIRSGAGKGFKVGDPGINIGSSK